MTLVATLVAAGLFVLLHWQGIGLFEDGWALWQAGVSMMGGHGNRTLSGEPIVSWPPLYSLYLALWTVPFGPTGLGLVLANGVLIVAQAWLWSRLIERLTAETGLSLPGSLAIVLGLFLGTFVAVNQMGVLAHNIAYVILPVYLGALWDLTRQREAGRNVAVLVVAGTLLMLSHNSCVAFVAAAGVVLLSQPATRSKARQAVVAALVAGMPIFLWGLSRLLLGQSDSHARGWDVGKWGVGEYLLQVLGGPGNLLVSERFRAGLAGWIVLCVVGVLLARTSRAPLLRFALVFVAAAGAVLFVLFNVTWIYNELSSARFVLFAPLLLVPILCATALPRHPKATMAVAVLLLLPQFYWAGLWTNRQLRSSLAELSFPHGFVAHAAYISRDYLAGGPKTTPQGVLVAAPQKVEAATLHPPELRNRIR